MNQKEIPGRLAIIAIVVIFSLFYLIGTFGYFAFKLSTPTPSATEPEALAEYQQKQTEKQRSAIRFGLDIQGGVDVLMSIDIEDLLRRDLKQVERDLRKAFRGQDILARPRASFANRTISITLEDEGADRTVLGVLEGPDFANLFESYDPQELIQNKEIVLAIKTDTAERQAKEAVDRTVQLLRERIDSLGLLQPSVVVQGGNKIRVQLPGETNPDEALAQITRVAMLEFRLIAEENDTLVGPDGMVDREAFEALNDPDLEILPSKIAVQGEAGDLEYRENEMVVERTVHVSGSNVENAQPYISQTSGLWEISLTFDRTGMVTFGRLTEDNPDRLLAIVLDGTVRSFPQINEPILGGRATISGNFTRDEAFTLTRVINTGALPVKLKAESSQVIGATLGSDSIRKSIVALGMGSAVIIAFICVYYGAAGIVAVIGLLINILAILALIAAGRGTLTLSGIGGVLLTLGMAVDANVLIYERIREELRHGKNAVDAIISGFDSAFYTIVDANVTTLITALILLQFGQGSVQGFALTMTFGIFATLFTGLYVTRTLFGLFFEKRQKAPLGALTIFREPKIRFIEKRAFGYIISTVVILAGIASVIQHGGLIPGTEFSGGVKMQVSFEDTDLGTGDLREAFVSEDERLSTIEVVEILGSDDFVVTSKLLGEGENQLAETTALLEGALEKNFPDAHVILSRDEIGNEVGAEFTSRAITSLIFASLGILFYVALRFEFWFGIAAVIALLHDVLITLGVLTFLDVEITLEVVAALLVVVGYSINDTIVIFDRVRENARLHRGRSYDSIINLSINESLNRTVVTSITTLIVILAMLIFGGAGLYYFALTLLIGLITGTYSSSFVASPFLAYFMRRQGGVALPDVPEKQVKKEKPAPAPAPEDFEDDEDDEEDDEGELAAVGADAAPASAPAKKPARPKAPTKTKKSGKKRPPTRKGGGGKRRKKK